MMQVASNYSSVSKVKAYIELLKPRLSFLVSFSSGFGYILGARSTFDWAILLSLMVGGFLVSGASVIINQILEKPLDEIMSRTKNRPLPTGRVAKEEAVILAFISGFLGLALLWVSTNLITVWLSLNSLLLYAFVYTPLKRIGPVAVFVGAIPGALPPFIGWVAATGVMGYEPGILFGIQFIWQFPHFWAVAWVCDDDYKKAGFKLLPGKGTHDSKTAINIMMSTLFLLPLGLMPTFFGMTGITSAVVATICGVLFLSQTFALLYDNSIKRARRLMFGSFIYLPIVQIAFLLDKV
ncbi:MAG: protoheme IX farnesyltransferase [Cytophagales bacterium]|nr:protoheme IX farnesyltransferase [Cytophagales bacterium]